MSDITQSIDSKIQEEYGKKGVPSSEMFKLVNSVRSIEQKVADLFEHKIRFVFNGDQELLNKMFKEMKMDYKAESNRAE